MKIIICDDDRAIHEKYKAAIKRLARAHRIDVELFHFSDGKTILNELGKPDFDADTIYLDISKPDLKCYEAVRMLRKRGFAKEIIFSTASADIKHFRRALKYKALDYIIKDVTAAEEFDQIFLEAAERYKEREQKIISLSFGGDTRNIPIQCIHYFEYRNRKIHVYYEKDQAFAFWDTLDRIEKLLKSFDFLRIHSAYLVQLAFIDHIKRDEIVLKNGKILRYNKNHYAKFRKIFNEYVDKGN